ncbi:MULTISPECIES: MlaD family protein [Flavobacterium]|uniref:MlaD family protein n=1 Tax=Flavobacterium TaxID=237 RepID=UPI00086C33C4|nr:MULTISPECIES: MlaD family protein [Flavobacterium]MBN9284993.1 MCE family protein [Flavobacterium sp.]ODS81020.1 MAG: organic solvent ABC transporter substrate-binding protein [Chryseobacterium sp. SCN 40-13]OJV72296.1 MAG: organic solvent ABC transporter substrate-binding protein [Flavobacterium sp. 40-81]
MKITREIKTAILVITSIVVCLWGYSFLKGKNLFDSNRNFYVVYDNVEGLSPSAPITINGLVVGKINSIEIQKNTGKLLVEMQIKNDFAISKSSIASIYEPGFIGGKQIAIIPNFKDTSIAQSGDYLQGDVKQGLTAKLEDKLAPIQERLDKVLANADVMLTSVNNVLDPATQANLKSTVAELNKTLTHFSAASANVDKLLADNKGKLDHTITNIDKVSTNFAKMSDTLAKANLGKTIKNLETTLANVDKIMLDLQAGKGTMGKLLKDEAMYKNLAGASKQLELLLGDMKLNPKRYVHFSLFGKKAAPYVAPEEEKANSEDKK